MKCIFCRYARRIDGDVLDHWDKQRIFITVVCPFQADYKKGHEECTHNKERIEKNKANSNGMELCPFCGEIPTLRQVWIEGHIFVGKENSWEEVSQKKHAWDVICNPIDGGCGCSTSAYSERGNAVNMWNKRVKIPIEKVLEPRK